MLAELCISPNTFGQSAVDPMPFEDHNGISRDRPDPSIFSHTFNLFCSRELKKRTQFNSDFYIGLCIKFCVWQADEPIIIFSNRNVTRISRIRNFKIELVSTLKILAYAPAVAILKLLPPSAMVLGMNTSRPCTNRPNT
jgi:hypothetical protein